MENINTKRGDTLTFDILWAVFTAYDPDIADLVSLSLTFTMKRLKGTPDASAAIKKLLVASGSDETQIATLTLTAAQTEALRGTYFYDVQFRDPSGVVGTIQEGVVTIADDCTRSSL